MNKKFDEAKTEFNKNIDAFLLLMNKNLLDI